MPLSTGRPRRSRSVPSRLGFTDSDEEREGVTGSARASRAQNTGTPVQRPTPRNHNSDFESAATQEAFVKAYLKFKPLLEKCVRNKDRGLVFEGISQTPENGLWQQAGFDKEKTGGVNPFPLTTEGLMSKADTETCGECIYSPTHPSFVGTDRTLHSLERDGLIGKYNLHQLAFASQSEAEALRLFNMKVRGGEGGSASHRCRGHCVTPSHGRIIPQGTTADNFWRQCPDTGFQRVNVGIPFERTPCMQAVRLPSGQMLGNVCDAGCPVIKGESVDSDGNRVRYAMKLHKKRTDGRIPRSWWSSKSFIGDDLVADPTATTNMSHEPCQAGVYYTNDGQRARLFRWACPHDPHCVLPSNAPFLPLVEMDHSDLHDGVANLIFEDDRRCSLKKGFPVTNCPRDDLMTGPGGDETDGQETFQAVESVEDEEMETCDEVESALASPRSGAPSELGGPPSPFSPPKAKTFVFPFGGLTPQQSSPPGPRSRERLPGSRDSPQSLGEEGRVAYRHQSPNRTRPRGRRTLYQGD